MPPAFNAAGDLPPGIYSATIEDVIAPFGRGSLQRQRCTSRLQFIVALAQQTAYLEWLVLFGSYVTAKEAPNDVDLILIMHNEFRLEACPPELLGIFDHATAQARYGASIFWIRPQLVIGETVDEFIGYWQSKRDGSKRGIIEVLL